MNQAREIAPHYKSLDLFKFLAALLVVVIHTRPRVGYLALSLCRIAVPFFFVCSSYLFWKKTNSLQKYNKRMATIYLVWSVLYLPYIINTFFNNDAGFLHNILQYFHALVFHSTFHASWYLMGSLISMNLVWLLSRRVSNVVLLIIGVFLYCLSLLSCSYYGLVDRMGFSDWFSSFNRLFVPSNSFIVAFIYIVIGKILAEKEVMGLHYSIVGSLIFLIVGILEILLTKSIARITDAFVFLPLFIFFLFQFLINLKLTVKKNICILLRNCSILIYLFHYMCIDYCFQKGMTHGTKLFLVVAVVATVFAFLVVKLSNKFRFLKYLY